jgi:hypothetical protein
MAIKCTINQSVKEIVWGFSKELGGDVTLHLGRVSSENLAYAVYHGLKQRGTDTMALKAEDYGGRVPESAKRREVVEMVKYLESGATEWTRRASGGVAESGLMFDALCALRPDKTQEQIREFLRTRKPDQLQQIKAREDLIEKMNELRLERAPKIETSGSLDDLDAMGS